jgi:hypothetical protein
LWPRLNNGSRVAICTNGGRPKITASRSAAKPAIQSRSARGRTISAAAASISGSAPTYHERANRNGISAVSVPRPQ